MLHSFDGIEPQPVGQDIVDQFSPWLTERFTYFTSKVYQSSAAHHAEASRAPSRITKVHA